jgi:uncharacterized protein (DUF58 family)
VIAPVNPQPTRTGVQFSLAALVWVGVALVLGVVGWYKTINLLLLACYVLLALLALNGWIGWRMVRQLRGQRHDTPVTFPKELVVVAAEISNDGDKPITAMISDSSGENTSLWLLAPLMPTQTQKLIGRWEFSQRGSYPVGPLLADASYPLGLVHIIREIAPRGELLVLPAVGRIDLEAFRRWLIRGGAGDAYSRRPSRRQAPGQGDVRGLRAYRPGDSPRDVHWKSTARRSQLVVREYDRSEPLDLLIVLDPYLPEIPSSEQIEQFEWLLSLATTMGKAWGDADDPTDFTLILPGLPPLVQSGRASPWMVREVFKPLATLQGSSQVPMIPMDVIRRRSNRAARLLLTTRSSSPLAESFRAGGQPFAVVSPSDQIGWFTPPTGPQEG